MRQLGGPRWLLPVLIGTTAFGAIAVFGSRLVRSLPNEPRQMSSERAPSKPGPPPPRPFPQPQSEPAGDAGSRMVRPRLSGPPRVATEPRQRGVSLGLFAEDVSFDYGPLLEEIAGLGATHVALVVPLYQDHGGSTRLYLHTRLSPSLSATADAIRAARRAGLEVMVFPIIRLLAPRSDREWRGTLAPDDIDDWFASYLDILGDLGALAGLTGATRLAIGSELSSLDGEVARWARVIERIRAVFPGTLVYSANWDHYREAKLLDLVDEAGIVAYFELRSRNGPSGVEALERRWSELRGEIDRWRAQRKQPFIFTELGYRSRVGASAAPWDESGGGEPDLEEQRRAFEAFRRVWTTGAAGADVSAPARPVSPLAGLYIWNWYGWGGPGSISYTPRGKPAAEEVRRILQGL
jgi:hypothetical protein